MKIKRIKLNSAGDTIVEVLLSMAALSLVLSASYGLANISTKTNVAAKERSEAQKLTERQLELLRGYVSVSEGQQWENGTDLCFRESDAEITQDPAECSVGIDGRYAMTISYIGTDTAGYIYTVTTTWTNLKGNPEELKLSYKLPATGDIDTPSTLPGPVVTLTATAYTIPYGGFTIINYGSSADTISCTSNPDINGGAGQGVYAPGSTLAPGAHVYTFSCSNADATTTKSITINVTPP